MKKTERAMPMTVEPTLALENLSALRWRLVWIYDSTVDGGRSLPYFPYPTAAWFIRKGTVRLHFFQDEEFYRAGQWVFPRQAEGRQTFSMDAEILSLRFQAEWPDGTPLFDRSRTMTLPGRSPDSLQLEKAATKLLRFLERQIPAQVAGRRLLNLTLSDYVEMQPLVSAWIAAYFRTMTRHGPSVTSPHAHPKVNQTLRRLQSHPLAQSLRVASLAREAGLSVSQLNKIFVQETGTTPAAIWTERRLRAARTWLLNTTDSIKAISIDLGFSSSENFSHWFRNATGQSPSHFRGSHPIL